MTNNYAWSPSKLAFYPVALQADYEAAGTWPNDVFVVTDAVFQAYAASAPAGMTRGADVHQQPAWVPIVVPALTPLQAAQAAYAAAIASGLSLTSAGSPELNSVYSLKPTDTANVSAEALFITLYQEFTNGLQTFDYPDASGTVRTFPSTAAFMAFAKAAAQYVSACNQTLAALAAEQTAAFPSNQVAIP